MVCQILVAARLQVTTFLSRADAWSAILSSKLFRHQLALACMLLHRASECWRREAVRTATLSSSGLRSEHSEKAGQWIAKNQASTVLSNSLKHTLLQDFSYTLPGVEKTVLSIILGGGAGTRLYPLTKKRAKPAVPLGANYRLIDIPVSNCLNSNINKIYCLTQFNSASLNRHLTNAYNANVGTFTSRGFVEVLAATQTTKKQTWFQGAPCALQALDSRMRACAAGVSAVLRNAGQHLLRLTSSPHHTAPHCPICSQGWLQNPTDGAVPVNSHELP